MKEKIMSIAEFMKKNINADDFKLYVNYNDEQCTRFAQNTITQHISGDYIEVSYVCIKDQRIGTASTRQIDEENLLKIIQKAEEIAVNNSPDTDMETTLSKEDYPELKNYFPAIETLDTAKMIEIIKKCIDFAETKQGILSGIITKSINEFVYMTKNGFLGYDKSSEIELSMTLRKEHIETKTTFTNKDFEKLCLDGILSRLNEQFDSLKEMRSMDFEAIPVILRPQAVEQLFMFFNWYMLDRKRADEGLTPLTNQIGQKFFGEKFNIISDINDKDLTTQPFSSNNVHKTVQWVKDGVILDLPTSRQWAQKHNLIPSYMFNFIIEGEGVSEKEMMKMVKRGLIINNLWYIRLNDLKTADFTGMTRDGVMYFEDGEIKYAVNNFRFNEQIHDVTKRILATGESVQQGSNSKVPAMLIKDFVFVDKTTF
ncbi:MAG: metallopeptidase TldD-related protein [Candidatus Cloacimonetes bacterium]|nr:metallopeptidase TldD-related protein [Candidatus Cloacimonadota bacterium]